MGSEQNPTPRTDLPHGEVIDLDVLFAEVNGDVLPTTGAPWKSPGLSVLVLQWVWVALLSGLGGLVAELTLPLQYSILTRISNGPLRAMTADDIVRDPMSYLRFVWHYALLAGCLGAAAGLALYVYHQKHPIYKPNWVAAIVGGLFVALVVSYPFYLMKLIYVPVWIGLCLPYWMERWPKRWHRVLDVGLALALACLPVEFLVVGFVNPDMFW